MLNERTDANWKTRVIGHPLTAAWVDAFACTAAAGFGRAFPRTGAIVLSSDTSLSRVVEAMESNEVPIWIAWARAGEHGLLIDDFANASAASQDLTGRRVIILGVGPKPLQLTG